MLDDVLVLNTPIAINIKLVFNVYFVVLISMMPLTLNILINRSLRSSILIFYWMMMSDRFCSWTTILLISLIAGAIASVIVHHLADGDSKCTWASVCSTILRRREM